MSKEAPNAAWDRVVLFLVVSLLLGLSSLASAEDNANFTSAMTRAVVASRDIKAGETIAVSSIAVVNLPVSQIARGVPKFKDYRKTFGQQEAASSYFFDTLEDAAGKLSLGLRKGQVLYFSYPGLRGDTVVVASKGVPDGAIIGKDSVIEQKINPNYIPIYSCAGIEDVIGKRSSGIKRGEVIVFEDCGLEQSHFRSVPPGPHANRIRLERASAKRKISKGEVFSDSNIQRDIEWAVRKDRSCQFTYVAHPEGLRAKVDVSKGQIITTNEVTASK